MRHVTLMLALLAAVSGCESHQRRWQPWDEPGPIWSIHVRTSDLKHSFYTNQVRSINGQWQFRQLFSDGDWTTAIEGKHEIWTTENGDLRKRVFPIQKPCPPDEATLARGVLIQAKSRLR